MPLGFFLGPMRSKIKTLNSNQNRKEKTKEIERPSVNDSNGLSGLKRP